MKFILSVAVFVGVAMATVAALKCKMCTSPVSWNSCIEMTKTCDSDQDRCLTLTYKVSSKVTTYLKKCIKLENCNATTLSYCKTSKLVGGDCKPECCSGDLCNKKASAAFKSVSSALFVACVMSAFGYFYIRF